jgi:uncharacterized SAM-binding protein YcdF (DUF218 family)
VVTVVAPPTRTPTPVRLPDADNRWALPLRTFSSLLVPLLLLAALFVTPAESPAAASADVVAVLAGARERLPAAVELAERGSGVLLVSVGAGPENAAARRLCRKPGDLTVYCFDPSPATTRGEARAIGQLLDDHDWDSVALVTSAYHLPRARVLLERCTTADIRGVAARPSASVLEWTVLIGHELGGLAQSASTSDC